MSVYCRKGIWYVDYRPDGVKGKRIRIPLLGPGIETREDAMAHERTLMQVRKQKPPLDQPDPEADTIEALWDHYARDQKLRTMKTTLTDIRLAGKNLERIMGKVSLSSMTIHDIKNYQQARHKDGVSNRTINKELTWFSGFCKWARKLDYEIPAIEIPWLPYRRPIPIVLTKEECLSLLSAAPPFYRAYFALAYMLGLRRHEIAYLTWADIDERNKCISVMGKGGKRRLVPAPDIIMDFIGELGHSASWVFPTRDGNPCYWITRAIKRIALQAGITKNVTPHLLRHSFATHLLEIGVNLRTIQDLLGHSTVAVTEWYTHVALNTKRAASNALMTALEGVDNEVDNGGQSGQRKGSQNPLSP